MMSEKSAVLTGEAYVRDIDATASNRRIRAAFRALVLKNVAPGATIFDFGAGPGSDALFYARSGIKVAAFDIDPQMRASFKMRCSEEIERGRVTLQEGTFSEFLKSPSPFAGSVDVVTANFAPLSMIDDLRPLFVKFAELTRPGGKVIASVLNPWSFRDLRYVWWWRHRFEYWRAGEFWVAGPSYRIHRRSTAVLRREAKPEFLHTHTERLGPASGFLFVTFERH